MLKTEVRNRSFHSEEDVQRITQFLLDTFRLNQTLHNWDPRRWQGRVYHRDDADYADYINKLPGLVHIWQDNHDNILGVVIPEYDGGVFLQIHPDYRTIEAEMLAWSEQNLMQIDEQGQKWLEVWVREDDHYRQNLVKQRGYQQSEAHEIIYRRKASPVQDVRLPEGYLVRSMRHHPEDWQGLADLLNAAFNRTMHQPEDYQNFQKSPFYRAEFDIVVQAPDGTLAANAGFMVHERELFAQVEPVCTHPEHQGKGLARVAITEGLRRIQKFGADAAFIGAWYSNPVSNHLYQKLGFTDGVRMYMWHYTG